MNREIVPGCLCLIVYATEDKRSQFVGRVVTATRQLTNDNWEIVGPNLPPTPTPKSRWRAMASSLLRIDGHDDIETMYQNAVEAKA